MFRVLTVILFTYYFYRLFSPIDNKKYGLFFKQFEDDNEEMIKDKIDKMASEEFQAMIGKLTGLTGILIQQIIEFLYLILALKYDPMRYPTIAMLIWWIVALVIPKKKSIDDILAKIGTPKYKIKKKIIAIIDLIYFGYMFFLLVMQYF